MNTKIRRITALVSVVSMLLTLASPALAGDPSDDLKQIEYKYYFRGKYPQAVDALTTFLARVDVNGPVAVRANEFLAASHVLAGSPQTGKGVFAKLLASDPNYPGPDVSVFKPDVLDVYRQAQADYAAQTIKTPAVAVADSSQVPVAATTPSSATTAASKPIYKKWWFYAGAAAVVGAVALAAGGGGDDASSPRGTISVGVNVK